VGQEEQLLSGQVAQWKTASSPISLMECGFECKTHIKI